MGRTPRSKKILYTGSEKILDRLIKEASVTVLVINGDAHFYEERVRMTKTSYSSTVKDSQGVAVAQGTKARASSKVKASSLLDGIDQTTLAHQLAELRQAMKSEGTDVEHDLALSAVAGAEKAAREGNKSGIVSNLKKAGTWTLGIAEKLALSVAEDAIKKSIEG